MYLESGYIHTNFLNTLIHNLRVIAEFTNV